MNFRFRFLSVSARILPFIQNFTRFAFSQAPIMPRNVEIKARVHDFKKLHELAVEISGDNGELLVQEDTFFKVPNGRLKLREIKNKDLNQLVFYLRPDVKGPKLSDYHVSVVSNPSDLKRTLELSLGIVGVLKKKRWLYMVGQTRVHVDQVEGLGDFMELEVVLDDEQSLEEGQKIADDLMEKLHIDKDQLMVGAYMDHVVVQASQK